MKVAVWVETSESARQPAVTKQSNRNFYEALEMKIRPKRHQRQRRLVLGICLLESFGFDVSIFFWGGEKGTFLAGCRNEIE